MNEPLRRPAGLADLDRLPEGTRAEVIDGVLYLAASPNTRHQWAAGSLLATLFPRYVKGGKDGPGGWWILHEIDVLLDERNIVQPDLVGWRRERMPSLPDGRPIRAVPDWICEIVSPSSGRNDRLRKADLYLRSGVRWYWLLDPAVAVLEAFGARDAAWVRLGAWSTETEARVPPFDDEPLDVAALFPPREEDSESTESDPSR